METAQAMTPLEISKQAFRDEAETVGELLAAAEPGGVCGKAIRKRAEALVTTMRREVNPAGVEVFLSEYGLDTKEGVALLCVAEALLRIPDNYTAARLVEGLSGSDFAEHLGRSESLFVNASSWGLMLTGKLVEFSTSDEEDLGGVVSRLVGRLGEKVARTAIKSAIRLAGGQFVLGETIAQALAEAKEQRGYIHSFDMLGEGARTQAQADDYFEKYRAAIRAVGAMADKNQPLLKRSGISVKLSALHPRLELRQEARVMRELMPKLKTLLTEAHAAGIPVSLDAEEATRFDLYLTIFEQLWFAPELADYHGLGFVLQAYQKRAYPALELLRAWAAKRSVRMPVRLVKGAYWDSEIKAAQELGLPGYPVFTRKCHTDVSYLACAVKLLEHSAQFYPQFATHNALSMAEILELAGDADIEFQRLHGMGEALHDQIAGKNTCRIYAPVGTYEALLPYLIRRLLENGANTSFVHLMVDSSVPLAQMLADPLELAKESRGKPSPNIPLPEHLYPDRKNSGGFDLGNRAMLQAFAPLKPPVLKPVSDSHVAQAVDTAHRAAPEWNGRTVQERADMLRRAADLMEQKREELIALIMGEGKRTLGDAISEVREAADYCRYYAAQADRLFAERLLPGPTGERNAYALHGRGVFACISPWNFPLAIFLGQVTAALVAGNAVLAKPAEPTPRIAARAIALMHEAGVPRDVLSLVIGKGSSTGAALIDGSIDGVAFTGSTATAKRIQQALAKKDGPIIPLIAETGGINAMIVDSSALLEQAVDDVVRSGFGSAGQRCSALRLLILQEDIADALLEILVGAMAELKLGDPFDPATDVGPVITADAQAMLEQHIERLKQSARLIAATPMSAGLSGTFVAPHAFELAHIEDLKEEIFGPVLHVVRYQADQLGDVIARINATGFGLTFGLHSRIRQTMELVATQVQAGNIYINRSMIGATVGVQPFGGEGLSGTGPKAGGPYTLLRFASEKLVSTNTAAIGGNLDLLR